MLSLVVVTDSDLQNLTRLDKLCVLQNMVIVCCSFPVLMDRFKKKFTFSISCSGLNESVQNS